MNEVYIYSDNSFAKIALAAIVSGIFHLKTTKYEVAVFSFESRMISPDDILLLINCKAQKVLIFARNSLINFLSFILEGNHFLFVRYDTALVKIQRCISVFFEGGEHSAFKKVDNSYKKRKLTTSEKMIITLYINGLPLSYIAFSMKKSIKTISAQKKNAMRKMGLESDIELIQTRQLINIIDLLDCGVNRCNESECKGDLYSGC